MMSDLSFEKDFNRYLLFFFLSTLFTAVSCHSSHAGFSSGWILKSKCSYSPWPLESSTSSFSAPRVCFLRPMHISFFHPAGTAAGGHSGKAIGGETPHHHYTIYCRWQKNMFILFWGCFCKWMFFCYSEDASILGSIGLVKHPKVMSCIYITLFLVTMLIIAQQVINYFQPRTWSEL